MNSKKHLLEEAERLYLYDLLTIEEIANKLHLNRKTVMAWRDKCDWDTTRANFLKTKQGLHQELYELARYLIKGIATDLKAGEKIDTGRLYAFFKIIPMFTKVKDYEDIVAKKDKNPTPKGITPELIAKIEAEVLGITHNDNANEEE